MPDLYQLLPPLAPEEAAQLEASIRAHGVEDPIAVDEEGNTLDGHHRRMIAERLGLPYETKVIPGLSEDEKRLFAIRKNTERRQLTKAQRALVGMRAEPSFRREAKARQGARTDIRPDLAKRRQVWSADEAARLVGLPLSTYKTYRNMIIDARREHGEEATYRQINTGAWDIGDLRLVQITRQNKAAAQEREREKTKAQEAKAQLEETAKAQWDAHGLLGLESQKQERAEDAPTLRGWTCPECDAFWPDQVASCARCSVERPADASVTAGPLTPWGTPWAPGFKAPASWQRPAPATDPPATDPLDPPIVTHVYYDRPTSLAPHQASRLIDLRDGWATRYVDLDAKQLATILVKEWHPDQVTKLRSSVRRLLGWLGTLDEALQRAVRDDPGGRNDETEEPAVEEVAS